MKVLKSEVETMRLTDKQRLEELNNERKGAQEKYQQILELNEEINRMKKKIED